MRILEAAELEAVSGGEVGATHMGDDYHYTGEVKSRSDMIQCLGANGDSWLEAWWICL